MAGREREETHSLRGPTDRTALLEFRDVFESEEPLAAAELDDFFDPDELRITLEDGIGEATGGRFDVVWSTRDDYNIHYTDDLGRNLRWDVHPHDYPMPDDDAHFHPPPNAASDPAAVESSCIEVAEIRLVARATIALWRAAYDTGSIDDPNGFVDPP
ncbi:hypothetical protein [Haloterrigena alkaliphila]|uniref:Uncharacterized protein n=1 Tax=Haloterrigena alkaliphila TaxID=2816475 RepID=A0A8A2VDZ5_9EURY|nr:hypothetical protein [Haloterrigena alkaliphila]QSX00270.1 hypothetical protein J0X25_04715 [Haloterrigena alkaliphila]